MVEKYVEKGIAPNAAHVLHSLQKKTEHALYFRNFSLKPLEKELEDEANDTISYELRKVYDFPWQTDETLSLEERNALLEKRDRMVAEDLKYAFSKYRHYRHNYRANENGEIIGLYFSHHDVAIFRQFPEEILDLSQLEEIYFEKHVFPSLPNKIASLSRLKLLRVSWCKLEEVPSSLGELKSLRYLNLEENKISRLPESIGNLKNLLVLNLFGNNLQELPESLKNLENLMYLNLGANKFEECPQFVHELENLLFFEINPNASNLPSKKYKRYNRQEKHRLLEKIELLCAGRK